jgi:hypothetical protein
LTWKVSHSQGELSSSLANQSNLRNQVNETQQAIAAIQREKEDLNRILNSLKQEL